MKRIISIIVVTTIIFLIGFVFLRVENEDFAETLLDDAWLNSARIRKNKEAMSWSTMSWDVTTGAIMTWVLLSGSELWQISKDIMMKIEVPTWFICPADREAWTPPSYVSPSIWLNDNKWTKEQVLEHAEWYIKPILYCSIKEGKNITEIRNLFAEYWYNQQQIDKILIENWVK